MGLSTEAKARYSKTNRHNSHVARVPATTIMDKSLGTLLRFWGVFQFTQVQPLPSPYKQCWTRVSRIFSEIQLCIGWGEGELQEHFENDAVLRGSREMTGKYAYCSTVPRTFVQDCSSVKRAVRYIFGASILTNFSTVHLYVKKKTVYKGANTIYMLSHIYQVNAF